jgi:hypothetical protein
MIDQAFDNEKRGTLVTISPPCHDVGLEVCKIEGHSWEKVATKDVLICVRCCWTISTAKYEVCQNCNFFDCVDYCDYHHAHVKPTETCEVFRGSK